MLELLKVIAALFAVLVIVVVGLPLLALALVVMGNSAKTMVFYWDSPLLASLNQPVDSSLVAPKQC